MDKTQLYEPAPPSLYYSAQTTASALGYFDDNVQQDKSARILFYANSVYANRTTNCHSGCM